MGVPARFREEAISDIQTCRIELGLLAGAALCPGNSAPRRPTQSSLKPIHSAMSPDG